MCPDTWNADDIANGRYYFTDNRCANRNPSGLLTVALYSNHSDSDAHNGEFRVYNWIAKGYDKYETSYDTIFVPFTSDGIFQNVDKRAIAVGQIGKDVGSQFTNIIHTIADYRRDVGSFEGDISCEGLNSNVDLDITSTGSAAKQCLVNGDKIFFYAFPHVSLDNDVNMDMNNYGDFSMAMSKRIVDCNAALTNLLTVKNVAKFPNSDIGVDGRPAVLQNNMTQFFIETVEATNARMQLGDPELLPFDSSNQAETLPDCAMYIYKYIANKTATPSGGYEVTQPCSGRGLCDSTTGTCNCFSGYSNDNCDKINNFAV
jgi:hypothetical protein